MIAFLSRTKRTLLCKWIEAPRYVPAGNVTSPPPSALHFAIARLIAAVSLSLPFPVAPKSRTLNVADLNWGTGKFGGVDGSGAAARAKIDNVHDSSAVAVQRRIRDCLLNVNLANAFLLPNGFNLVANFVCQPDVVRNRFDNHQRRRRVRGIKLNVLYPAKPIEERLPALDVFDPIKFERVGDFAEHAVDRFQTFSRHFVDRAFGLEITLRRDKDWHGKKDQNVRA